MRNTWIENSVPLRAAFLAHSKTVRAEVRFQVVTRAIIEHFSGNRLRILDVGGGAGEQAFRLAEFGHQVVVVDPDPDMIEEGLNHSQKFAHKVADVTFIHGTAASLASTSGAGQFDLICCHSVLMYLQRPNALLNDLAKLTHCTGAVSILSLNSEGAAMRSGMQRRWVDAACCLEAHGQTEREYARAFAHTRSSTVRTLGRLGFRLEYWQGVGMFSDHLPADHQESDLDSLVELEWQVGSRDPYRRLARNYHMLFRRHSKALDAIHLC